MPYLREKYYEPPTIDEVYYEQRGGFLFKSIWAPPILIKLINCLCIQK